MFRAGVIMALMRVVILRVIILRVIMVRVIKMLVRMRMLAPMSGLLLPLQVPRRILLPIHPHIHLGGRDPAARHPRNLQPRLQVQARDSFLQQPGRNSGIHQRAQKHVAAHAGKTL